MAWVVTRNGWEKAHVFDVFEAAKRSPWPHVQRYAFGSNPADQPVIQSCDTRRVQKPKTPLLLEFGMESKDDGTGTVLYSNYRL